MPKVVANPAIAVVGDKAYVIGGYFSEEDRMLEDVIVYDFQTGTWITTGFTPLPTPRGFPYSHAVPVVDGKIYLVGGLMGTPASSWPTDVVEIYDTRTMEKIGELPARSPSGIFLTARAAKTGL